MRLWNARSPSKRPWLQRCGGSRRHFAGESLNKSWQSLRGPAVLRTASRNADFDSSEAMNLFIRRISDGSASNYFLTSQLTSFRGQPAIRGRKVPVFGPARLPLNLSVVPASITLYTQQRLRRLHT